MVTVRRFGRELLRGMAEIIREVGALRPWLLLAAVGIAYGFAIAVLLLPFPFL